MSDIFHTVGFHPYDARALKRDAKRQKLSRMLGQSTRRTWGSARQHRHVPSLAALSFSELSPDDWDVIHESEDELAIRGTERFDINVHDAGDGTNAGPVVALLA